MSSADERRRQKALQKKKDRREAVRRAGGARREPGTPGGRALGTVADAASWPVGPCHASASWHERGARVHAAFTRFRDDGLGAAAYFELDLAERGVVSARVVVGVTEGNVLSELGGRSEEEPILEVQPALVVKLVEEAARHGAASGHGQPKDLADARRLFAEVSSDDCAFDILVGPEQPRAPVARGGLWGALLRRLGLD